MDVKLTLKLEKTIIENAKEYANAQGKSLSSIVESYLLTLTQKNKRPKKSTEIKISPFVKSMVTGVKVPLGPDYKKEYSQYLEAKYK